MALEQSVLAAKVAIAEAAISDYPLLESGAAFKRASRLAASSQPENQM